MRRRGSGKSERQSDDHERHPAHGVAPAGKRTSNHELATSLKA
jgi:hypothetical protein